MIKIIDKTGLDEAVEFIYSQIQHWDTSKIDWFKCLPLNKRVPLHGRCTYPKRIRKGSRKFLHQYQIRCSVNVREDYWPRRFGWFIGTKTVKLGSGGSAWTWIEEEVVYHSAVEALIWVAGHECYHWLRHSRQIPGKNTQCQANKFGLNWLYRFRESKI